MHLWLKRESVFANSFLLFHQVNATAVSACDTADKLKELCYVLVRQPQYSPDFGLRRLFVLPILKNWLAGKRFLTNKLVRMVTNRYFEGPVVFYHRIVSNFWMIVTTKGLLQLSLMSNNKTIFSWKKTFFNYWLKLFSAHVVHAFFVRHVSLEFLNKINIYPWHGHFKSSGSKVNRQTKWVRINMMAEERFVVLYSITGWVDLGNSKDFTNTPGLASLNLYSTAKVMEPIDW